MSLTYYTVFQLEFRHDIDVHPVYLFQTLSLHLDSISDFHGGLGII